MMTRKRIDQINMAYSSVSISSSSASSSAAVPLFHHLRQSERRLLDRCIQFLDQVDRVRAARTSKFMFEVCCSPESWSCEGVLESLRDSALKCGDKAPAFQFNGPTLRLHSHSISGARGQKLFEHARCIQFRYIWRVTASGPWKLCDDWPSLEHLFLYTNQPAREWCELIGKLPSGLKSCTVGFDLDFEANFCDFLPSLPSSLHTLQILMLDPESLRVGSLEKFPNLQQLMLISKQRPPHNHPTIDVHSSTLPQYLPSLRIYCDLNILPGLCSAFRQTTASHFSRALTHLRVHDCEVFNSCPADIDWAEYFPHLNSLHVAMFPFEFAASAISKCRSIPVALGARIRSLVINELNTSQINAQETNPFIAMISLEKLTLLTLRVQDFSKIGAIPNLTHLSIEEVLYFPPNIEPCALAEDAFDVKFQAFCEFGKFPKLKVLDMDEEMWPARLLQRDPHTHLLTPKELDERLTVPDRSNLSQLAEAAPIPSLTSVFPALTELNVKINLNRPPTSSFQARKALQTIPHLRSVKWGNEPQFPRDVESYFSLEAIAARETSRLRQLERDRLPKHCSQQPANEVEIATAHSTVARHFNMFNLSLAFQALTPVEVARASTVSKHWRSAALSPLVLRHHIRVEMHQLQGAVVHGPQIRISDPLPMMQAVRSAVFRNLRILTLSQHNAPQLPRETLFANRYLRLFKQIPYFTSLHTLALSWTQQQRVSSLNDYGAAAGGGATAAAARSVKPSAEDLATIARVMESPALQHLKVFRIMAAHDVIYIFLRLLPKLKSLEVLELRHLEDPNGLINPRAWDFAPLLQLPLLKRLYVCDYGARYHEHQLVSLHDFCKGVSADRFEEVLWRVPLINDSLQQIIALRSSDKSFTLPHVKSVHISELYKSLQVLSDASAALPHLCDVSIGRLIEKSNAHVSGQPSANAATESLGTLINPLPAPLAARLRSLKLKIEDRTSPHGPFILPVLQALIDSKITQLECLHIFRQMASSDSLSMVTRINNSESIINDTLYQLIERSPALTELNCPTFDLGGRATWLRLIPRLHVVYAHPLVKDALEFATQLREYHCLTSPSRAIFLQLLSLPHFQSVSYVTQNNQHVTSTRGEVVRMKTGWIQQEEDAKQMKQRALQLLESSLNPEQMTATWQQANKHAQTRIWEMQDEPLAISVFDEKFDSDDSEDQRLAGILTSLSTA